MSKSKSSTASAGAGAVAEEMIETISREELERLYDESMKSFKQGEVISGKIMEITPETVIIDIGFKSEGVVSREEFSNFGRDIKIGDEVEVFLEETEDAEGNLVLSKEKANRLKVWEKLNEVYEKNDTIEGIVAAKIKGGLTVDIGLKAFLPGSQIDLRPPKQLERYIGEKMRFKIIKMNKKRGNIVLSRRVLLEEERKVTKESTISRLKEGAVIEGVVKNITEYGVFLDLGGVDGLLHITDISWGRVNHPSEHFSIGDTINVKVLKFDPVTERVSLGMKQINPDPWTNVEDKYSVGSVVEGKVISLADYGAFVELEQGIEGLVHISEMTWNKHVRHPSKIVTVGDTVKAKVLNIDKDKKRISLGIKQLEANPWETIDRKYPVGSIIEGKVRNITEFGAFIELEEGVDGLIHISDMSWTQKVKHPSEILKKKDAVRAVVLAVDKENERLSLGLKQLEQNPWEGIEERYKISQNVTVKVVKVTNFGAFVEIEPSIEGLIHVSQLSKEHVQDPKKLVKIGDMLDAKIVKMDVSSQKIGLSVRAYVDGMDEEQIRREFASKPDLTDEPGAGNSAENE